MAAAELIEILIKILFRVRMQIFIGIHTPVHFISLYSFQLDLTLTSWWLAGELRTQKINVWKSLENPENQVKKGNFSSARDERTPASLTLDADAVFI